MAEKITSQASLIEETNYTRFDRDKMIEDIKGLNLSGIELVRKIEEINSKLIMPTGRNIYEFCRQNPDSTWAAGIKRVEKAFDLSDWIYDGFSSGKDSTISANLTMAELNLRYLRYNLHVDRDGRDRIDILDEKWAKNKKKLFLQQQDAEVVYSMSNQYTYRFIKKYGPEGLDLLEYSHLCLPLSWQSGVSFDSGVLVSWDENKKDSWVQPMPTKEELHGFDVVSIDTFEKANPVELLNLPKESQDYHREVGNVIEVARKDIFDAPVWENHSEDYWNEEVEAVCNFGRGPFTFFERYMHEKDWNHSLSEWFVNTSPLVDQDSVEYHNKIREEIAKRYPNLSQDVWQMTPAESQL